MIHTHTMQYYSAIKKITKNLPFVAIWMDFEGTMLINKKDKEKESQIQCGVTYRWNLKKKKKKKKGKGKNNS